MADHIRESVNHPRSKIYLVPRIEEADGRIIFYFEMSNSYVSSDMGTPHMSPFVVRNRGPAHHVSDLEDGSCVVSEDHAGDGVGWCEGDIVSVFRTRVKLQSLGFNHAGISSMPTSYQ